MPTSPNASVVRLLASLSESQRSQWLTGQTDDDLAALLYCWPAWARDDQLPPTDEEWVVWLLMAGRGAGKTRAGAEWVRAQVESGAAQHVALIGRTAADCRDVMVEGDSGLLSVFPPAERPRYYPSKRRVVFVNGATATTYSGEEPDLLRGPQHDAAWADELASWRFPQTWDNMLMGLRKGRQPRAVVTTTPKPVRLLKELIADETTRTTKATTYDNRAHLAESFFRRIIGRYEGTRTGRQELLAELLEDVPGALWRAEWIEQNRVSAAPADLYCVVVSVDPAVTSGEDSDETGIIGAGVDEHGHAYVLEDASGRYTPDGWGEIAVEMYHRLNADAIVAETNNGGDVVESLMRTMDRQANVVQVKASRGKVPRAEPVAAQYKQGLWSHVGVFAELEEQMRSFTNDPMQKRQRGDSPDRMDALVWAGWALTMGRQDETYLVSAPDDWAAAHISPY
jgi:phage terminase large subunit-like protein